MTRQGIDDRMPAAAGPGASVPTGVVPMGVVPADVAPTGVVPTRPIATVAGTILFLMTMHALHLAFSEPVDEGMIAGSSARGSLAYLALFALQGGLFALVLGVRVLRGQMTAAMMVAALACLFPIASTLWSASPQTTLFNAAVLSNEIVAAYVLSVTLSLRDFLRLFLYVASAVTLASFALLVAAPELAGTARYGGGWLTDLEFSGVMSSKNHAGYVFAATAVLCLHGRLIGANGLLRLVVGPLAVLAVVLSNSATALVALVLVGGASTAARFLGPERHAGLFVLHVVLVAMIFAVPFVDPGAITGTLDRDATFTGRTDLWAGAFEAFGAHPILGYGYNGFFGTGAFSPVWDLWDRFAYFFTDSFHNSMVDTAVSLGIVGAFLLAVLCVTSGLVVFRASIDEGSRLLAMALLGVYMIGSTMELAVLHHNHIATIIVFAMAFKAAGEGSDVEAG